MKVTPITSEQYLRDQLSKNRQTDIEADLIRQFENQIQQDKDGTYAEDWNKTPTDDIKQQMRKQWTIHNK